MKKFALILALCAIAPMQAFANGKPAATCDHVENLWSKVEYEWKMRQWPRERDVLAGLWQDRTGKKWVFETDGEGACLKPFKEKK